MGYIDLHLHSHYSDGIYSPKDLIKRAKSFGFSVVSITDHQTVAGLEEAIKIGKKCKVKVIPGVEINDVKFRGQRLHLLGYGIDWKNKELNQALNKMQKQRKKNVKKCILELQKQGFRIKEEKIFQTFSQYIGFGWLAGFLDQGKNKQKIKKDFQLKNNQIVTLPEIYKRYFIKNGQSILLSTEISLEKIINVIKKSGGISVLAHPGQQLSWSDDWLFPLLKKKGVRGLEAVSSHHNWANIEHYQKIAKQNKFLITIGSDYHGDVPEEWKFLVKSTWQYFKIVTDPSIYNSLEALICKNL